MAIIIPAIAGKVINIGRAGENLATIVTFDVSDWLEEFSNAGTFSLVVQQNGGYYPQSIIQPGTGNGQLRNIVQWKITNSNTSVIGLGKCELIYTIINNQSNIIVKSMIYDIVVTNSLDIEAQGSVPSPIENWIQQITERWSTIEDAAKWAVGPSDATTTQPSATNNAKYYSEQAALYGNLTAGTTTTGAPGSNASARATWSNNGWVLNFTIPRGSEWFSGTNNPGTVSGAKTNDYFLNTTTGAVFKCTNTSGSSWTNVGNIKGVQGAQGNPGTAATITVGTVTTGNPGTNVIVNNRGTSNAAILDFTIPEGKGLQIAGAVEQTSNLPTPASNYQNQVYIVGKSPGHYYYPLKNSSNQWVWSDGGVLGGMTAVLCDWTSN